MPKKYRLSRADFARLDRARGKRLHGAHVSLLVVPLGAGRRAKAGCIIGKKILPRAVDRNALERRVRAALLPLVSGVGAPVALVVYPKREARSASFREITDDIARLAARIPL